MSSELRFLVIGAQKSGTTSLWQYLRKHPRLCMPMSKEAPFFTQESPKASDLRAWTQKLLIGAPSDSLLGKVTPDYMVGQSDVPVEVVAKRIAATLPDVKLIALLRDPVERAVSSYMMAVRREQESRSIDVALSQLVDPEELGRARLRPSPNNSYIAAGEYGRLLGIYRDIFPSDRLLVAYTEDLARDPGGVLDAVLGFLDLPIGFRPEGLGVRHFQGGRRKLLDREAEELLFKFYREEISPYIRESPSMHRKAFEFFYETWNVSPGDRPPDVSAETREMLERHFTADAEKLEALGVCAPWISHWS